MTSIPLPTGISGASSVPKRQEYLNNLYFADGYIDRRPGVEYVTEAPSGECRGSATWYVDGNAYFVIGSTLWQLDSSLTLNSIGSIAGSSDVVFSLGQVNLVIVVKGGNGYTYNQSSGLTQITDSDYLPSASVDFIDGRHVFIPSDGSPAFYSEVDQAGNINPLNFFDAEELPDLNKVTINVSNNLYIGGGESFEIYRGSGNVNAPIIRREGARIDVGYVSGIERYMSSFMFIGRNRDQSYAVHLMAQGSTQIVSNEAVNEILNGYTQSELEAANSFSFVWNQHYFVGWNLARNTLVFVDGNFIYFDSNLDATTKGPWNGRDITFAHGRYYVGDRASGKIGKLVSDPVEYGAQVEYELKSFVKSKKESYFSPSKMVVDCLTGQDGTTLGLALSDDGRDFYDFHYRDLGVIGSYNRTIEWSGGLGVYESLMAFKLRGTGDVRLSIEGVEVS